MRGDEARRRESPSAENVATRQVARPRRVVLAEDEALIRLDLKEMLEEEGYEVVGEAGDGETAVRLARDIRPDVTVLDIKMPGLDGLSAAERIAEGRHSAVLILTAFSQKELVERAANTGAMGYLVKPFQKADLIPAIDIAVARHRDIAGLKAEVSELGERLETRKLLDRAKGLLMDRFGMTEQAAFRLLQKRAMDERRSVRSIAEEVLTVGG